MIALGIFLLSIPLIYPGSEGRFVALGYGVVLLILGIYILLNKKEDRIEGRKDKKWKK